MVGMYVRIHSCSSVVNTNSSIYNPGSHVHLWCKYFMMMVMEVFRTMKSMEIINMYCTKQRLIGARSTSKASITNHN